MGGVDVQVQEPAFGGVAPQLEVENDLLQAVEPQEHQLQAAENADDPQPDVVQLVVDDDPPSPYHPVFPAVADPILNPLVNVHNEAFILFDEIFGHPLAADEDALLNLGGDGGGVGHGDGGVVNEDDLWNGDLWSDDEAIPANDFDVISQNVPTQQLSHSQTFDCGDSQFSS